MSRKGVKFILFLSLFSLMAWQVLAIAHCVVGDTSCPTHSSHNGCGT